MIRGPVLLATHLCVGGNGCGAKGEILYADSKTDSSCCVPEASPQAALGPGSGEMREPGEGGGRQTGSERECEHKLRATKDPPRVWFIMYLTPNHLLVARCVAHCRSLPAREG